MRIRPTPTHLKGEGKKFWRDTLKHYLLPDPEQRKMLEAACGALDEMQEAREKISAQSYYTDRWGQPREHPAHKVLKDNASLFARLCREIGLTISEQEGSRMPRKY